MPVRIAVVSDDSRLCGAWLRAINGDSAYIAVAFRSGSSLRSTLQSASPQVVVIDQRVPGALQLSSDLKSGTAAQVIFVNVSDRGEEAMDALASGARGIVYESAPADEVRKAIQVVGNNQVWAPRHVIVATWTRMRTEVERRNAAEAALAQRLSAREREVLRYAAAGLGNKEVASWLAISESTVKVHLTHIFQKLGVRGRAELAAAYHGILR